MVDIEGSDLSPTGTPLAVFGPVAPFELPAATPGRTQRRKPPEQGVIGSRQIDRLRQWGYDGPFPGTRYRAAQILLGLEANGSGPHNYVQRRRARNLRTTIPRGATVAAAAHHLDHIERALGLTTPTPDEMTPDTS